MKNYQENIVPALNQNSQNVFLYENSNSKIKILFVGNSITKHEPKPEMGWTNDCGMAASSEDKDYVHLLLKKIQKYDPDLSFGIVPVGTYERTFFERNPQDYYSAAAGFNADIVIMFFGANVSKDYDNMENPPKTFAEAYEGMRNFLSCNGKTKFIHSMGFYIRPILDDEKKCISEKYGDIFVDIEDIRTRDDTHGRFNHPNDLGMKEIAERFWQYLEPLITEMI